MIVKYPNTATTEASRLSVCFRLDELLREEHNAMGVKFQVGEITETTWKTYLKDEFEVKSRAIHAGININREIASKGTFWNVSIKTAVIKEVGEL